MRLSLIFLFAILVAAPAQAASVDPGVCHQGKSWTIVSDRTTEAFYEDCMTEKDDLVMTCTGGLMRLTPAIPIDGLSDGERVKGWIFVDGGRTPLWGTAKRSATGNGVFVTLQARVKHPVFSVIAAGKNMVIEIGSQRLDVHLQGARKAMDALRGRCR